MLPKFQIHYKALTEQCGIGIKTYIDQWNTTENSEINSHKYNEMIFDKVLIRPFDGEKDRFCFFCFVFFFFNEYSLKNWMKNL